MAGNRNKVPGGEKWYTPDAKAVSSAEELVEHFTAQTDEDVQRLREEEHPSKAVSEADLGLEKFASEKEKQETIETLKKLLRWARRGHMPLRAETIKALADERKVFNKRLAGIPHHPPRKKTSKAEESQPPKKRYSDLATYNSVQHRARAGHPKTSGAGGSAYGVASGGKRKSAESVEASFKDASRWLSQIEQEKQQARKERKQREKAEKNEQARGREKPG